MEGGDYLAHAEYCEDCQLCPSNDCTKGCLTTPKRMNFRKSSKQPLTHVNFKACTKNRQNQHKSNRIHKSAKTNTKKGQSQHKSTTILKTLKSDKTDTKKGQSQHKSTTILYNIKK